MAKKGKKTRRRAKTTVPLTIVGPIVNEFFQGPYPRIRAGNWSGAVNSLVADYTGYDMYAKRWVPRYLKNGAGPVLVGAVVHKIANRLGINRMIARAGIPWIRI